MYTNLIPIVKSVSLITDGISPYVLGGMQRHSFYLAKYFAQAGIRVDLYHTNQSQLDINKLEVFSEDERKYIRSFVIPFPKAGMLPGHYIRASYKYSEAIFNVFKEQTPTDFIIAKGFSGWKLIEEKSKGFKCMAIGVNFHGYEMFQESPDFKTRLSSRLLLRRPVSYNMKHADFLFSYGGKITTLINSLGYSDKQIIEIPGGIEESWLTNNNNVHSPLRFVFMGRNERRKGIEELNDVLSEINHPGFEFHFIGPIPKEKQIEKGNIVYHGETRDIIRIQQLLSEGDVLVCPSHSEGMPNVILEGMASGLAIIATDVGAVSKMVSSENGLLIPPANKEALKDAIQQFLSMDKNNLELLKRNSTRFVQGRFLWKEIIQETISRINAKIV